jgi:hypothetical protein
MTPTTAMEVILGLLPLHVMSEAEIYRLMCTQQWRPKSANLGQTKRPQDMEHEPILHVESETMLPRYAFHKPFRVTFPEKC